MQKQIPNKLFFKIGEVCEITDTQPYVLRYWESEFPALAPAKNSSGQRIYRRRDIETVLRIKQLLYGEGLTLAGVRRKLTEEAPAAPAEASEIDLTELMGEDARERILVVKRGLRELSAMLSRAPGTAVRDDDFRLHVDESAPKRKERRDKPRG